MNTASFSLNAVLFTGNFREKLLHLSPKGYNLEADTANRWRGPDKNYNEFMSLPAEFQKFVGFMCGPFLTSDPICTLLSMAFMLNSCQTMEFC